MNQIGVLTYDFTMHDQQFAQALYSRWEPFFAQHIQPIFDEVMAAHNDPSQTSLIKHLEIQLEPVEQARFDELFPVMLRGKLEEALQNALSNPTQTTISQHLTPAENDFDTLCSFLLSGTFPWHAKQTSTSIQQLFMAVLQTHAQQFKAFLLRYGHYTSLQQRLAYQLQDKELQKTVRLLAPSESTFICAYVKLVIAKYPKLQQPTIKHTDHRHTVWSVVLTYLLTDRSSYFDRKSFLQYTIQQLATRYNMDYSSLLGIITAELDSYLYKHHPSLGLLTILKDLSLEIGKQQPLKAHEQLLSILSTQTGCRQYIDPLTESAIRRLVYLVFPVEGNFVIAYAHALDQQHQHGYLQGKTGGEFSKLKWQFIFPVLLEDNGSGFNRKHFIKQVLSSIAAHYNLHWQEVITYLYHELDGLQLPLSLQEVLIALYADANIPPTPTFNGQQDIPSLLEDIMQQKIDLESLRADTVAHLKAILTKHSNRYYILSHLGEPQRISLLAMIFPKMQAFAIPYARLLDRHEQAGMLQGKAGGEFRLLKWEFIFASLLDDAATGVNRQQLVYSVLSKIAAHYNLYTIELLEYFHKLSSLYRAGLPGDLAAIISVLHQREKAKIEHQSQQTDAHTPSAELTIWLNWIQRAFRTLWGKDFTEGNLLRRYWFILPQGHPARHDQQQLLAMLWKLSIHKLTKRQIEQLHTYHIAQRKNCPEFILPLLSALGNAPIESPSLPEQTEKPTESLTMPIYDLPCAGIVLLSPFLPRLFSLLNLTAAGKFNDLSAQTKGIFILQQLATGEAIGMEHDLALYKLLVGLSIVTPIPPQLELTDEEVDTVTSLMEGALTHWSKLNKTSPSGLREAFLQRSGKLEERHDAYHLTVEEKTYDMLLDSVPWQFRKIKYQWMEKSISVHWR